MIALYKLVIAGGILALANGPQISPPEVPDSIKAPAGEKIVLQVHATGSQIYVCQVSTDQKFSWTLKAPEAELTDANGKKLERTMPARHGSTRMAARWSGKS